jgi:phosphomannomutase
MEEWREAYLKQQSRSDIRGVAVNQTGGATVNLTQNTARNIAAAFADYLADKKKVICSGLKVGGGYDSRISAQMKR